MAPARRATYVTHRGASLANRTYTKQNGLLDFRDLAFVLTPIKPCIMPGAGGKAFDANVTHRIRAAALRTE